MPDNTEHFELHLTATIEISAIDLVAENSELSKSHIKQTMTKGAVWQTHDGATKRIRRAKKILAKDDQLHIYYDQSILLFKPETPTLIDDHQDYSVWHKPYGVYCQGSKWGDHCTINRLVAQQTDRPTFIVHRLDRATTGLIIVAHSKKAAASLASLFEQREIEKKYIAVVEGNYPQTDTAVTINRPVEDREAVSHIKKLSCNTDKNRSSLEVLLETGRKHQIRRHLSETGFPIIGDRLYGSEKTNPTSENLKLTCYSLAFICPLSGKPISIQLDESLHPSP